MSNNSSATAFTAGTAKVIFAGSSAISISGTFATAFNTVWEDNSSTVTANSAMSIKDTLELTLGTFAMGTYVTMGTNSLILRDGTMSLSGTLQGTNVYDAVFTNVSTSTSSELNTGLRNVTVNVGASNTVTFAAAATMTGNLIVYSGSTFTPGTFTLGIGGNLTNN